MNVLKSFRRDQRGVTAIEYALIAAAMSLAFATAAIEFEMIVSDNIVASDGSVDLDTISNFGNGSAVSSGSSGGAEDTSGDDTDGSDDTGDTSGSDSSDSSDDGSNDGSNDGNNGGWGDWGGWGGRH